MAECERQATPLPEEDGELEYEDHVEWKVIQTKVRVECIHFTTQCVIVI